MTHKLLGLRPEVRSQFVFLYFIQALHSLGIVNWLTECEALPFPEVSANALPDLVEFFIPPVGSRFHGQCVLQVFILPHGIPVQFEGEEEVS